MNFNLIEAFQFRNFHKKKFATKDNEISFRVESLNVGLMRKKASEAVETMLRRVDLCCLQKTRWKTNLKLIAGRDSM